VLGATITAVFGRYRCRSCGHRWRPVSPLHLAMKGLAWAAGVPILLIVPFVAVIFGINATDEPLTEAGRKALVMPPVPPAMPDDAYEDLLALQSVAFDPRLNRVCSPAEGSCLKYAADHPDIVRLNEQEDAFAVGYRRMRARAMFQDRREADAVATDRVLSYTPLTWGQQRALLRAASLANRGKLAAAIAELEAENAFHRRVAAGSRRLVTKMIALVMLTRDTLFASELALLHGDHIPSLLPRLKAIARPLSGAESGMGKVIEFERAQEAILMQSREVARNVLHNVYHSPAEDSSAHGVVHALGTIGHGTLFALAPYLYRPQQSINRHAAQTALLRPLVTLSAADFVSAAIAAEAESDALAPLNLTNLLVNPVGWFVGADIRKWTPYIGRVHAAQALHSLVALQIALREAGMTRMKAIERAAGGAVFHAHPDPFFGKPMRFDPGTRTVGLDIPDHFMSAGELQSLRKRYGRVAIELFAED